ncbi:hypothetical protein FB451DRAFT_1413634 [Mycena latifolia]|nr:hypothetical protein FB451DRAFT_1413634 [Mycena latifolia]
MYLFQPNAPPTCLQSHYIFQYSTRSLPALFRSANVIQFYENLPNALKSHGGFVCHTDESIVPQRAALVLYCGFKMRLRLVALPRTVPDLHQGSFGALCALSRGSVCVGMHRNPCPRDRRGVDRERGFRRRTDATPSPRMAGRARAGVRECAVSTSQAHFLAGGAVSIPRRERGRARTTLNGEDSCM